MKTYKTIFNFTVLTLALFTVISFSGLSQTSLTNSLLFGGKVGTNLATMKYSGDMYSPYSTKLFPRLMAGLFIEGNIANNISVRPEFLYVGRGVDIDDLGVTYTLKADYFDVRIPVIYSFNSLQRSVGFVPYVMVSPNFGFVVGGSINSQSYTADINKADIKYNDIALSAGLGLKFPVHISGTKFYLGIEAQYNLGLIDNFGTGNDFMNSTPCGSVGDRKNRGIEIAATISVPLGSSERPMISSDRVVYRTRIDTVYRDVEKFVYEDKPCYEIREIISYLKQGIDVHNKSVCMYNIQFDYNKAELSADSKRQVDDVIILMQNIPELIVKINGHTDNKGDKKYNQDLSEKRAKGVYDYMVKKGVDKSRLSYQGFGMDKPIADNKTEEGRSQNRRVEFEIINY